MWHRTVKRVSSLLGTTTDVTNAGGAYGFADQAGGLFSRHVFRRRAGDPSIHRFERAPVHRVSLM